MRAGLRCGGDHEGHQKKPNSVQLSARLELYICAAVGLARSMSYTPLYALNTDCGFQGRLQKMASRNLA